MMRDSIQKAKPANVDFFVPSNIGPKTNTKLVMAGMAFVQWIARMVGYSWFIDKNELLSCIDVED
jgi:hypothetical protein